jgi:hypothetical protein
MPQTIAAALVTYGGWTTTAAYFAGYAVTIAATVAYSNNARRKAAAKARAAANENAKDREVMIRSAVAPRRVIYGRDKVSGPIFYMQSTGDKSQFLHLCIALAAHECDAVEQVWFNDVLLPAPDANGMITSGDFAPSATTSSTQHTGTTDEAGSITLPHAAQQILSALTETGSGEGLMQTHYEGWAHTPGSALVTDLPPLTSVTIGYTYAEAGPRRVRVRTFLGTDDQAAAAELVAESGGLWTNDHRARGICYLYVRLEYDQDIFGSIGVPNISAVVRGKKVRDPRTGATAWSQNAALCVADFLRSHEGMRASAAEVPDSEIIAAANVCDEVVPLNVSGSLTQPRYTCNTSFTSEQSPRDVLADLVASMAGRAVWTQGRWLVRPGAYRTPTLTITADMLAGPVQVSPRASRSELFNAVRATYRDPGQDYAEVQAPLVTNAEYEAADGGVRIVRPMDVPTLSDTYRAQRLAKIELERGRQALTVRLTCSLRAYDLAPTDTARLTLDTYGFSNKPFEVLERTWTPDGLLQYTLRETGPEVWDWAYGEATVGDPSPNTSLPTPFGRPGVLANLQAVERAVLMGDGTLVTQALVTWTQSSAPFVVNGGRIDIQTQVIGQGWTGGTTLPGDSTSILLGPIQVGIAYALRARAVGASGRAGDWAYVSLVAQGLAAPPADVTGLAWAIKPAQVALTWAACPDGDYADTELRVNGADWDSASFLWRGAGTEYQHPRPPNGTYIVRAKHRDRSKVYSAAAATVTVTVDDTIAPGGPPGPPGPAGPGGDTGQSNHRIYRASSIGSPPATPPNTINGATPAFWSATPVALSTGQEQYQSDGTTPAGSTTTTWGTPYPSYLKVGELSAITANMGTLTAGSISTSGFVRADGNTGVILFDPTNPTLSQSLGTAMAGNVSGSQDIGVVGFSNRPGLPGVYGYNTHASNGQGVFGYGSPGVLGRPLQGAARAGVQGEANQTAGSSGVLGFSSGSSTVGVRGVVGFSGLGVGVLADASAGGVALAVNGPMTMTDTTLVGNLNADLLDGAQGAYYLEVANHTGNIPAARMAANVTAALGFTPVQQGGGAGQLSNKIRIGWGSAGSLLLQVDSTSFGNVWPIGISGNPVQCTSLRIDQAPSLGTALAFNADGGAALVRKPGSASNNTWLSINILGTTYYIPIWS